MGYEWISAQGMLKECLREARNKIPVDRYGSDRNILLTKYLLKKPFGCIGDLMVRGSLDMYHCIRIIDCIFERYLIVIIKDSSGYVR